MFYLLNADGTGEETMIPLNALSNFLIATTGTKPPDNAPPRSRCRARQHERLGL